MMFLYTRPAVSFGGFSVNASTTCCCCCTRCAASFNPFPLRSSTPPASLRSPPRSAIDGHCGSPAAPGKGSLSGSSASSGASGTGGYASSKGGRHGSSGSELDAAM